MNPNFHEPKLSMPKYHCPVCNKSPKTLTSWKIHLNGVRHLKKRKTFLDNHKDEMAILTAQIDDASEKLQRLYSERKHVKKLRVTVESNVE